MGDLVCNLLQTLYWQFCEPDDDPSQGSHSSSSSSSSSQASSSDTYLVGFIIANIVGIRHYSGTISGREMVGLVREPLNPYDENAIKVFNTRTVQVGHVERVVAAVLAPLIDSQLISVEGIVPSTRSGGSKFRIACQVHIFARVEAFDLVKSAISRGGLVLISDAGASFALSEAVVVKEKKKGGKEVRSVDEIFKLVDENVGKKAKMEALEPPREVIKSVLFEHQKEGLGWLVHRENSGELPPFWEERDGEYVNVLTNYHTDKRPEPLRGGVFADDMGLGKTLTLLSLIAFDKFGSSIASRFGHGSVGVNSGGEQCGDDEVPSDSAKRKGKRVRTSKGVSQSQKKRKTRNTGSTSNWKATSSSLDDNTPDVLSTKSTLVVCPPSVFSTWITQLSEHTVPGKMKVYMYYGDRTRDAEELRKYDIVLTTYTILATEESWEESPVKKIEWWRVILDEAHLIKNVNAQQSQAVTNLKAKRRWAVTGTPIQNGSFDLFSLMAFLRFEPFSIKSYWQSLIQRPLSQGNQTGLSRLQVLMATISLRRTKNKSLIGLPQKTIETCYVELSHEERELYDQMEREAKSAVQECIDAGSLMRNYTTVLGIILRLRQICISMALCPPDLKSLLPSNNIEDVSNNPELLKKLVAVLQDAKDRNSTSKSVVYSQFRRMLLLLEEPLRSAGFKILRLDGSMNAKKRAQVIEEFGAHEQSTPTVLLASLKASGTGINLTAATTVYLLEPWWNPAVEEQAMDRVHRIGQKEDVKIVRLIARNSIEERILELQERKKKLAREAFGKRASKDRKEIGLNDLRSLMSL
ncbi:hypothetical protein NL676_001588 [Syzygium grande]|nr:hypothetical protein NL676_001588 [Syzygium grande]